MRSLVLRLFAGIGVCFFVQASWAQGEVSRLLVEDTEFSNWKPYVTGGPEVECYGVPYGGVTNSSCAGGNQLTGTDHIQSSCDDEPCYMEVFKIFGNTVPNVDAYSPASTGTLNSVTAEFNVRHTGVHYNLSLLANSPPNPLDTEHEAHLLILQDGTFFVSSASVTVSADSQDPEDPGEWGTFGPVTLEADDFVELASADIEDVIAGSHPNFVGAGSGDPTLGGDILFGIAIDLEWHGTMDRNSPYDTSGMTRSYAVDDFTITVNINDEDDDGVPDGEDNCIYVQNANQYDSNSDGYGNVCDGDTDNNGFCLASDFGNPIESGGINACIAAGPICQPTCLDVDMNGDGFCLAGDYAFYFNPCVTNPHPTHPAPPIDGPSMAGRSGLACAGETPGDCPPHN